MANGQIKSRSVQLEVVTPEAIILATDEYRKELETKVHTKVRYHGEVRAFSWLKAASGDYGFHI